MSRFAQSLVKMTAAICLVAAVVMWGGSIDPTQNIAGLRHAETVRGTLNKSDDTDQGYTVEVAVWN